MPYLAHPMGTLDLPNYFLLRRVEAYTGGLRHSVGI